MKPLTSIAHEKICSASLEGRVVVDATVGNGYDTMFLAQKVGRTGLVYAFDIQPDAIASGQAKIDATPSNVKWILDDHANLNAHLETLHQGQIVAIMFNLGYLPGGNREIVTELRTTCAAVQAGIENLTASGVMTILCYRGHIGGAEEYHSVHKLLESRQDAEIKVEKVCDESQSKDSPVLFVIQKKPC